MKCYRYLERLEKFGLSLEDTRPALEDGEALIKVVLAGVCATDLALLNGYKGGYKGVLGHEFVGRIVDIKGGQDQELCIGDRVVAELNICCESCAVCNSSDVVRKRNHCPNRKVLGIFNSSQGAFAEYISYPLAYLFKVPDAIPDRIAVFIEPFAAAYRIVEQRVIGSSPRTRSMAVVGDGRLGLLIALVLSLRYGKESIVLFGRHKEKMGLVRQHISEDVVVGDNWEDQICKYENAFDMCVSATGSMQGLMMATRLVRPLGSLVLKSTCAASGYGDLLTPVNNAIVVKEIVVYGSRCGPFDKAIELMNNNLEVIEPVLEQMVSTTLPFNDVQKALDLAKLKGIIKVLLEFAS